MKETALERAKLTALDKINYLSKLPIEQRKKELKHIDNIKENHNTIYTNKRQGYLFPPKRYKKVKAIFRNNLPKNVEFRLNIHKQPNGRITLDIPKQYTNEFKDGQLVLFKLVPI